MIPVVAGGSFVPFCFPSSRVFQMHGWISRSKGVITIAGDVFKVMIVLKGVSGAGHLVLSRLLLWRHSGGTEKPRSHNLSRGRKKS